VGNCNATAGMDMPGYATTDLKGVQTVGTIKGGKNAAQAVISDFKKKLDSLAIAGQPAVVVQTTDTPTEDLSMATNTSAQELPQGVVGILEGFGLLDYQTDLGAASTDAANTQADKAQASDAADMQAAQMSGQFARMLTNEQQGETAANLTQQPDAEAGKYSGSLESTNNQTMAAGTMMPMDGDVTATQQLMAKMLDATAQTAMEPQPGTQQEATVLAQGLPQETVPGQPQATAADQSQVTADNLPQTMTADHPQTAAAGQTETASQAETAATDHLMTMAASDTDTPAQATPDEKTQDQPAASKSMPTAASNTGVEASAAKALNASAQADKTQAAEPQKTAQGFVKDNVIRIVDKVSANAHEGRYEFDVELKPDFLGKVSIKLTMQDGEIRMRVQTDDLMVKGMFSDQTSSLTNALKEKGIVISTVDVSYQDPMAAGREAFSQSGGGNGQKREGHVNWSADRYSGSDLFDTITPTTELLGGSSVEYLA